jgi:hypothetical protein
MAYRRVIVPNTLSILFALEDLQCFTMSFFVSLQFQLYIYYTSVWSCRWPKHWFVYVRFKEGWSFLIDHHISHIRTITYIEFITP